MLEGTARKLSFFLTFLSAVGWVAFVVGFGIRYSELQDNENPMVVTQPGYLLYSTVTEPEYFLFWTFAIGSMLLYIVLFTHLLCGNSATEGFTLILVPLYLISAGGVLQSDGIYLYDYHRYGNLEYFTCVPIEFAGVMGSVVCYWLSWLLWMCHSKEKGGYTPIN